MGKLLLLALGFVAVGSSYWWGPLALRPLRYFGVRRIEVSGTRYLTPQAVVSGLGLGEAASVFDNLGVIERRVAAMGGVARASVRRRLPGTLRVAVTEIEPVALAVGPAGLIPVSREAKPLPYDVVAAPLDAPIVSDASRPLLEALAMVQATDLGLYADVASARILGKEIVLEMTEGRVRLTTPVDPEVVRSVSSVRRDLASHRAGWRELDGRFRGWIVVRKG